MNKTTKQTAPVSKKVVIENKEKFSKLIDELENNNFQYEDDRKETITTTLEVIKDELLKLKDKKIPYRIITKLIKQSIGLKVREQSLRAYCQNQLGFEKSRKNNSKNTKVESLKTITEKKKKTEQKASTGLEANDMKFD